MTPTPLHREAAWAATALVLAQVPVGLAMRRLSARGKRIARSLHLVFGLSLVALAWLHGWWAMTNASARSANTTGLWFATAAAMTVLLQLVTGVSLIPKVIAPNRSTRHWHLVFSFALLIAMAFHLFFNGWQ